MSQVIRQNETILNQRLLITNLRQEIVCMKEEVLLSALEKTDIAPIKVTVKKTIRTQIVKNRNQMETQIPQSKSQAAVTKEDIIDSTQITQHTPEVVITQMDKTDNVPDVDDFVTVRRKNRVRNQNQITGTAEVNQDINFAAEPKLKRAWIYIGNKKKNRLVVKTSKLSSKIEVMKPRKNYRAKEKHNLFVWELILLQRTLL